MKVNVRRVMVEVDSRAIFDIDLEPGETIMGIEWRSMPDLSAGALRSVCFVTIVKEPLFDVYYRGGPWTLIRGVTYAEGMAYIDNKTGGRMDNVLVPAGEGDEMAKAHREIREAARL